MAEEDLLRAEDLEKRSRGHVKTRTWLLYAKQGRLPSVRLSRRVLFRAQDFEKFIAAHVEGQVGSVKPPAQKNGRRKARRDEEREEVVRRK
jgi:hypothetical protein